MAKLKKELPEMVFTPENKLPVFEAEFDENTELNIILTDDPQMGFIHKKIPSPTSFLQSKGHTSYHEGQRMSITFEAMAELLKEYRNL